MKRLLNIVINLSTMPADLTTYDRRQTSRNSNLSFYYREPSHRGVCAQNLQTRGLKNGDEVTLVPIFCAGHVGMYQINLF